MNALDHNFKGTKNRRVRFFDPDDTEQGFFIEGDNPDHNRVGHHIEVMGDDFGEHNGYTLEMRLADAHLNAAAPELLERLQEAQKMILLMLENNIGRGRILGRTFLAHLFAQNDEVLRKALNIPLMSGEFKISGHPNPKTLGDHYDHNAKEGAKLRGVIVGEKQDEYMEVPCETCKNGLVEGAHCDDLEPCRTCGGTTKMRVKLPISEEFKKDIDEAIPKMAAEFIQDQIVKKTPKPPQVSGMVVPEPEKTTTTQYVIVMGSPKDANPNSYYLDDSGEFTRGLFLARKFNTEIAAQEERNRKSRSILTAVIPVEV